MKPDRSVVERLRNQLGRSCPPDLLYLAELDVFFGPNPCSARPALVCHVKHGGAMLPVGTIQARIRTLLASRVPLPSIELDDPRPTNSEQIGRWIGQMAAGLAGTALGLEFGSGVGVSEDRHLTAWIEFLDDHGALEATGLALAIMGAALAENSPPIGAELERFHRHYAQRRPSPETRLMMAAARAGDIPFLRVGGSPSMWQFGWGERSELFWVTSSNRDGMVGAQMARLKDYQKRLFEDLGLPTPPWQLLGPNSNLANAVRRVGFPCVVKPVNQGSGRGVTANITNVETLERAIRMARHFSPLVILEAHESGHDYRLMVIDGKLAMTLRLDPPVVRGDGRRSIGLLLEELNRERTKDQSPGAPSLVPLDESLNLALAGQQLTLASVPERGREVMLRTNANRATGGTATNVHEHVHPSIKRYAELLAEAAGFHTVGIDYVTPDISKSHGEVGGGFLEINGTPGMARAVEAGLVPPELAGLVLGSRPGRIPVSMLVASPECLQDVWADVAERLPASAGLVSGRRARIGAVDLPDTPLRPVERVAALLRCRSLKSLLLLWTASDLYEWGLPVDSFDRVFILGATLRPEWSELLLRHAARVAPMDDPSAVSLLVSEGGLEPRGS